MLRIRPYVWLAGATLVSLAVFINPQYAIRLIVFTGLYVILVYSMNLILGYGGLITFCHAAFYGIGAYGYALLTVRGQAAVTGSGPAVAASLPFPWALAGAVGVTALLALLAGLLALRFRGDYFIFATLGLQMVVFVVLYNWAPVTLGSFGIGGIPRPQILGWQINEPGEYLLLVAFGVGLSLAILVQLYESPFGLSLRALREDEVAAEALGISAFEQFLTAFVIAAAFAGLSGALFASYLTHIDPTAFGLQESILLMTALLLGGAGNLRGPVVGIFVVMALPELLGFVGLPDAAAANIRQIIFGGALIGLMYLRPQGLAGDFVVK